MPPAVSRAPNGAADRSVAMHCSALSGRPSSLVIGLVGDECELVAKIREVLVGSGLSSLEASQSVEGLLGVRSRLSAAVLLLGVDEVSNREKVAAARSVLSPVPLIGVWGKLHQDEERGAFRLALDGIILSEHLERALVPAVFAIGAGLACVPQALRAELNRENLSSRERQILGMVVMGSTNSEIAARLFLAESTVKSHLSSAYTKLGVRSRKDATALILDSSVGFDRGILAISAA